VIVPPVTQNQRLRRRLDCVGDTQELSAISILPRHLRYDLAIDTIGKDKPGGAIVRAGRERTDNAFTEIRYGRCERNSVEGDARGCRAARDGVRAGVEESPADILAGAHRVRRVGGESSDGKHRLGVTVGDGGGS